MNKPALATILGAAAALLLAALPARAQYAGNNALTFNGVNQFVTVPGFGNLIPTNGITIEFWANSAATSSAALLLSPDQATNRCFVAVNYPNGNLYWDFGNLNTTGRLTTASVPGSISNWVHYAFVASQIGNVMRVYTNGANYIVKAGMTPFARGNYDLRIGGDGSPTAGFNGRLDEFRVWNRARSKQEIQATKDYTLSGSESNLLLYFRFDTTNSAVATNLATATGPAYNGSLSNNPSWAIGAPIFQLEPTVVSQPASGVTTLAATLNAFVTPGGAAAGCYFNYGLTTNYGSVTTVTNLPAGNTPVAVGQTITGLLPATVYHFTIVATNGAGSNTGADLTFTTVAVIPAVATLPASGVNFDSATLNGTVNPGDAATSYYFQYGLTTNYGSFTATNTLPATNFTFTVNQPLTGLPSGTFYHFNLVAANSATTSVSADLTFHTGGATNLVWNTNDTGAGSLRAAIASFVSGDLIRFAPDLAGQTIVLTSGQLVLANDLTLDGSALTNRLILSGNNASRIFLITNNATVVLNSLTLTNGRVNDAGGAIYNGTNCTLTVTHCTLSGNGARGVDGGNGNFDVGGGPGDTALGGGIYNAGTLTLNQSALSDNAVAGGNGGNGGTFSSGSYGGNGLGGGIYNTGTLTLNQSTLSGNNANGGYGGYGGFAGGYGGYGGFAGGYGGHGGDAVGGGVYNTGTLTLGQSALSGNTANGGHGGDAVNGGGSYGGDAVGGGIYNTGTLTLGQSTISGNTTTGGTGGSTHLSLGAAGNVRGGGIYNAGTLILNQSTLSDNTATGGTGGSAVGGGIYNEATVTLNQATFSGNAAIGGAGGYGGGAGSGGGIYNAAMLTLNVGTFSSNSAIGGAGVYANNNGGEGRGGGIYNAATLTLTLVTFSGNAATGGPGSDGSDGYNPAGSGGNGFGGGIYNTNTLTLNQGTFSGNAAAGGSGNGGGIYNAGTAFLRNCLIALNSGGSSPDAFGLYSSQGHNLLGITGASTGLLHKVNGDLVGSAAVPLNPLLDPLANNGGPTLTMTLLPASPALDAGDDSLTNTFAFDQRGTGFLRHRGAHVDIGAYELDLTLYSPPSIVSQSAGSVTLDPATHLGSLAISASVNPNGFPANVWIQSGVSVAYGIASAPVSPDPAITDVAVNLPLTGLAPGMTWHYRVVAASAAGTTFGADRTVTVSPPGDFNGDGVVSQSELDAVYAAYLPTSPWLFMTNVAGLGGTNVTFTLEGSPASAYGVEYTTNLVDWFPLGPANPRYLFTDTNAPALPQRHYRLRWP